MESDTGTGGFTVSIVEPVTDPELADMVVAPARLALASPVALMLATYGADELQRTVEVRSCEDPSLYVPVAENCKL